MPRGGKRAGAGAPEGNLNAVGAGAPKGNRNAVGAGAPKGNLNAVGAGAPEGNFNALKHGERSRNWQELSRRYRKHPGRGHFPPAAHRGASRRNLNALKHGAHSKVLDRFMDEHPESLPGGMSKEKSRAFLASQLKPKPSRK